MKRQKKLQTLAPQKMYSPEEVDLFENHLDDHFGPCQSVFHELVSLDGMHIDIYIIEPTENIPASV